MLSFIRFLVLFELSWDLCFKGSFYWGASQAEAGSCKGSLCQYASMIISVHRSPLYWKSSWSGNLSHKSPLTFVGNFLFFSFPRNIKVLLVSSFLLRFVFVFCFFKKRKTPHPLWQRQFWFSKTLDNPYIQICQLEKDTERTFLPAVSTVRQTESTVWIVHVCVGLRGGSIARFSLSWFGERLWRAPLPLTSWLAGGMLLWHSPLWSRCSHSHLLHLVLQELQLLQRRRKNKGRRKIKLAEGILVCCGKRHKAYVAC